MAKDISDIEKHLGLLGGLGRTLFLFNISLFAINLIWCLAFLSQRKNTKAVKKTAATERKIKNALEGSLSGILVVLNILISQVVSVGRSKNALLTAERFHDCIL